MSPGTWLSGVTEVTFSARFFGLNFALGEVFKGPDRDRRRDRISGPLGLLHLPDVAEQPARSAGQVAGS